MFADFGGEFGGGEDFADASEEMNQEEGGESPVNQILATSLDSKDFDEEEGPVNQILDMSLGELPAGEEQEAGQLPDSDVEGLGSEAQADESPEAQETKAPEAQEDKAPETQENKAPEAQESKAPEAQENKAPEAQENKAPEGLDSRSLSDLSRDERGSVLLEQLQDALSRIFEGYGDHIPGTINDIVDRIHVSLRSPDKMDGLAGSYSPGRIEIDRTINIDELLEVIPHELLHAAGFHPNEIESNEDGSFTRNSGSGLDRTQEVHGPDGSVKTTELGSRGLDEGTTELLTQELLAHRDAEAGMTAARTSAYPGTTELCGKAADLVGRDAFLDAYFGGNIDQLQVSFDRLAGEHGFVCFNDALTRTLDASPEARDIAMQEATNILNHMSREAAREGDGKNV